MYIKHSRTAHVGDRGQCCKHTSKGPVGFGFNHRVKLMTDQVVFPSNLLFVVVYRDKMMSLSNPGDSSGRK